MSQLLDLDFENSEIDNQGFYNPNGPQSICLGLIQCLSDYRFSNNFHIIFSPETKSYFLDECADDLGGIWQQNHLYDVQQDELNFVERWLDRVEQFVESHSPEYEEKLALYDSLFFNSDEDELSWIEYLLDAGERHSFDVYLQTSMQQMASPYENEFHFNIGLDLCQVFRERPDARVEPLILIQAFSYYWSEGHRMSGKLFNKNLSPMRYVYLKFACKSIEMKYEEIEPEFKMRKFKALIQDGRHEDAIKQFVDLHKSALANKNYDVIYRIRFAFISTKWKLSIKYMVKLFDEEEIIDDLIKASDLEGACTMLSHLRDLALNEIGNNSQEIKSLLETKLNLFTSISKQLRQIIRILTNGLDNEGAIVKLADLYYFAITENKLYQFLPLIGSTLGHIHFKPDEVLSLRFFDEEDQFTINMMSSLIYPPGRNDLMMNEVADISFRRLIKFMMLKPGKDLGRLIKAFMDGSGFCSIFMYPKKDTDLRNHDEIKFAKVAFLLAEL